VRVAPRGRVYDEIDAALEKRGLSRRISLTVPHFLTAPHVVESTDLIATVPSRVANGFMRTHPVIAVELPSELKNTGFTLMLAWHERSNDDPSHRWFRQRVLESVDPSSAATR
jgi:DNA-binding transcriptional LysR family regulator